MASIRKLSRGDKRWQVRWREPSGPCSRCCATAAAAKALLARVQFCEDHRISYVPEPEHVPVSAIGDGVTAFVVSLGRSHADLTIERYRSAFSLFADYLDERGGLLTVADLSLELVAGFYDWLDVGLHGKQRSLYTKRRIVEKVEAAWAWLYEKEWSPAVPRPKTFDMKREHLAPVVSPSWAEMAACVLACVSEGPRKLATTLYYTGLRTSQAQTAAWDDVDMERGTLTVAPHKGLPGRIIPLSPHFLADLAGWGERTGRLCGWHVVHTIAERRLNEAWKRAGVRAPAWERAPGKAFRRGVTTGLAQLGANRELAELYVGRAVEGARRHYLDVGALPLADVANIIPAISAANVTNIKKESKA